MSVPFPWEAVLHAAFRLGWPPDAVWRATPRELALALAAPGMTGAPLRRDDLVALLRAYPDEPAGGLHGEP